MSHRRTQRPSQRPSQPPPLLLPSQRAKQEARRAATTTRANRSGIPQASTAHSAPSGYSNTGHGVPSVHSDCALWPVDQAARLPLGRGVRLIGWHPCGLYVLDNAEGILSHPNKKADIPRSLLCAPYSQDQECYSLPETPASMQDAAQTQDVQDAAAQTTAETPAANGKPTRRLYLLHRLDSATSGLLLLADNLPLAQAIRAAFADNAVRKTYLALCAATAAPMRPGQKGRWTDRLQRQHSGADGGVIHVRASDSGMQAATDYRCRKAAPRNPALVLLELQPLSGRTHQLRVHCAQHGLPIIGDAKYGDFRLNRAIAKASGYKRLFLHATALELKLTHAGQTLNLRFEAPVPPEFDALLQATPLPAGRHAGGSGGRYA